MKSDCGWCQIWSVVRCKYNAGSISHVLLKHTMKMNGLLILHAREHLFVVSFLYYYDYFVLFFAFKKDLYDVIEISCMHSFGRCPILYCSSWVCEHIENHTKRWSHIIDIMQMAHIMLLMKILLIPRRQFACLIDPNKHNFQDHWDELYVSTFAKLGIVNHTHTRP